MIKTGVAISLNAKSLRLDISPRHGYVPNEPPAAIPTSITLPSSPEPKALLPARSSSTGRSLIKKQVGNWCTSLSPSECVV